MELFLIYLLKVSVSLVLFYIVYICLLSKLTFHTLNRIYLLGSLCLSLLLPLTPKQSLVLNELVSIKLPTIIIQDGKSEAIQSSALSVPSLLFIIWLTVSVMFLLKFIHGLYLLLRLRQVSTDFKVNKASISLMSSEVKIKTHESIKSPFSFLRTIYLPTNYNNQTEETNTIINHERLHIDMKHSLDILLAEFVHCILWFHPMSYLVKNALKEQHEFYIDRKMTEMPYVKSISDYGQLLLSNQKILKQPSLVHTFYNSLIKKRILMMTSKKHSRFYLNNYILGVLLTLGLTFLWSCSSESESNLDTSKLNL